MEKNNDSGFLSLYILMFLVFFQAVSGLYGGGALVWDPSGATLQMPLNLLESSPFSDYSIPGAILLTVLGIYPTIVLYGLIKRYPWGSYGALLLSGALIIWIGVEILMIGYHPNPPLQLIYGSVGIAMLLFSIESIIQLPVNPLKK
ncbi:hypothetical protein [Fodinibius halophilus]|uniref:Uncharacterized protein n=1 Tax=Fodinibius halophilus TaxID=1736908 RepID=A0A6M1T2M7_9BACT|nr:hypothetical protein [Fodinibius halophilus]NGP89726.1 hypothetical protein [Fodinibius halophilus]